MEKLLLLMLLPAVAMAQCFSSDGKPFVPSPTERRSLYKGQQQFAIDLLNAVNKQSPTENIFLSPFSIFNALVLAYFAAGSKTENSIKQVLHFPESQDKISTMRAYSLEKLFQNMRALNGSDYSLLSANRLYVSDKLALQDCMKQLFENEVVPTDFATNASGAIKTINAWVSNITRNNINDFLSEGQLTEATNLVLANAAYFKGIWKNKFPPESTRKEVFYITASQSTLVPMMKQKSTFNHMVSEKLGAHCLEMPYKGDDISIFFLLPPFTSPSGIRNILERMKTNDFQKMTEELVPRPVEVIIPKFTIEAETKIVAPLQELGIGDLFDGSSDLSGLTGANDVKLDDAIHKAKIKLDEDGTTAAAATAIFNFRSSRPLDPTTFYANHPFVYVIFDKVSQTILFTGVFNKPPPA